MAADRKTSKGTSLAPPEPPRLLSESKGTTAALSLLEKAIKLIYSKEFKKARTDLEALIESHPGELEIIARARNYIQICEREEKAPKRPTYSHDQLYAMGVMEHNRGNYTEAIRLYQQVLEKHQDADYIYYSLAASQALEGAPDEAIENLRRAIDLNEDNRIYAKNDADFATLHAEQDFVALVGLPSPTPDQSTTE